MIRSTPQPYDVAILGAGLSGLTLALQLRQRRPDLRIAVLEKGRFPVPEAAHKVGEATVELGAHYLGQVLGLRSMLVQQQLPKLGLRLYFGQGENRDIAQRVELGPFHGFPLPSYQLDRGRLENWLAGEVQEKGVELWQDSKVTNLELEGGGLFRGAAGDREEARLHRLTVLHEGAERELPARWVVDATGRVGFLRRRLELGSSVDHAINAAWFRVQAVVDVDDWADTPRWNVSRGNRGLATNHLMGEGYWVWLIPLVSGATSIGIVADPRFHPGKGFNTLERALEWLRAHEPQCFERILPWRARIRDFLALKEYSHGCSRQYSYQRWAISGDAGFFADPLYSPGSDFIAMVNGQITELVVADCEGRSIGALSEGYNGVLKTIFAGYLEIYRGQYALLNNPQVMTAKLIWDFAVYWGSICVLYFNHKLTDVMFMARQREVLERLQRLGGHMQRLFLRWHEQTRERFEGVSGRMLDYQNLEFMQRLQGNLVLRLDDPGVRDALDRNLRLFENLAIEIGRKAAEHFGHSVEREAIDPYVFDPARPEAATEVRYCPRLDAEYRISAGMAQLWLDQPEVLSNVVRWKLQHEEPGAAAPPLPPAGRAHSVSPTR